MKKFKILIAEDEEMLQDLYQMILESEFTCETIKVSNGVSALKELEKHNDFNLIISDYNMPEAKGSAIYLYNKAHQNLPFFLFSGGEISDYCDFDDFNQSNCENHFFNKPFNDRQFLEAAGKIYDKIKDQEISPIMLSEQQDSLTDLEYIKVNLAHYLQYTSTAAEVYLKLNDEKFTKIINANHDNIAEIDLLKHYLNKGVKYVYVDRSFFKFLLKDIFNHFHKNLIGEKKAESLYQVSGLNFYISFEGLNDVEISNVQIEQVNEMIEETIMELMTNPNCRDHFKELCKNQGFAIGHSMLIMYVAGRICRETTLNFAATIKKICAAAFYHDYSLFEIDAQHDEMILHEVKDDAILKLILDHPISSAKHLPQNSDLFEETKKIIL